MKPFLLSTSLFSAWVFVQAQVVQWDIEKRHVSHGLERRKPKTWEEVLANEKGRGGYFSTVSIGTPGQNLSLQLDTGSSDIWVPWSGARICTENPDTCDLGSFDPKKSSSVVDIGPGRFYIGYIDGTSAKGDYITDRIEIGGVTLKNFTMGLAVATNLSYGLAGVGYSINEASLDVSQPQEYPNLPVAMYEAGSINSIAYSLWLNDPDSSTGSILFGGVDSEKYHGEMSRINVIKDNGIYRQFAVPLTSLIATSSSGSDILTSASFPITSILDCGTTLTYLPQDLAEQVWKEVGAEYKAEAGAAVIPCSRAKNEGYFSYQFAGPEGPRINITMDELVLDVSIDQPPKFVSGEFKGEDMCLFGVANSSDAAALLGDTFLRSAYVVYDLVNNEIGLAATDFNATKSNVIPFKSNGARIPSAIPVPESADTTQAPEATQTDFHAAGGFQAGSDDGSDNDNGASPVAVIGPSFMVVGVTLAFMLLGGSIFSNWL